MLSPINIATVDCQSRREGSNREHTKLKVLGGMQTVHRRRQKIQESLQTNEGDDQCILDIRTSHPLCID